MAVIATVNNLHEFGPQVSTCVLDPVQDEEGNPILDETGVALCPETDDPSLAFQMVVTGSSFTLGHYWGDSGIDGNELTYDYVVDWGDGGPTDNITAYDQAETAHTFVGGSGTYTISIVGACPNFRYGTSGPGSSSRSKIDEISQWGNIGFVYLNAAFYDCYNMTLTATDKPNFSDCIDIRWMFRECRSIVTGAEGWDFSVLQSTSIRYLFDHCDNFNCDLSGWNLTGITDMQGVLTYCQDFNNDITGWDTSAVTDMYRLFFFNASLTHASIATLDTSACTSFFQMLAFCTAFNVDISGWTIPTTAGAVDMTGMFNSSDNFNQNIDAWDVSAVTNMQGMFADAFDFNQSFPTWDTSAVTDMSSMFAATFGTSWGVFNGDVSNFDTSSVTTMWYMFRNCNEFNQDIGGWNVSNVTNMRSMFVNCYIFNQDLDLWDVSKVEDFYQTFANVTLFNGDITTWTPIAAENMQNMLTGALAFNQDISGWDISTVTNMSGLLSGANLFSTTNYDLLLNAWSLLTVQPSQAPVFTPSYTIATSQAARDILTNAPNSWTIFDGGGI